ncbi:hypothetical protein J7F01_05550 [Streptomyces sp. ISL-22]|uniref:DUF6585 family protein n=1 Tax=unclassified Streptomyces TaxID=2593676 RepID=UPI001BE91622|nr:MULTISPECIES: DUF6585 family protein [unclassified Streptomyces]MBT2423288.1 hypothetical protein [Streptomyces sp. ISL-24]MBT2431674.1 hypothetical protein [Streptomyces sp. ISL-22]
MNEGTHPDHSGTRDDELLLARVSEAAGRARLGRRRATYRAPLTEPGTWRAAVADARRLLRTGAGRGTRAGARLDLYEHGLTAAVDGRIHVVRYDTTVVCRRRVLSPQGLVRALVLVDVDGERIVLRCGDFGRPEVWGPEIRRAVTNAQVPRALAALAQGARLVFGPVWVTGDEVGSRGTSLRWAQVQRIEILNGSVALRAAGRWQVWGTVASEIPNLCVLRALAEHLAAAERDEE